MCVFNFNGTSYKVSLYTEKDNIDCGKIAKYFGGGGHRQAAGFITSNLNFLKNIKRS
jgi:nanoRNase/pAp phosphatase (c-di-AMP/oligoRNAs hydrolase)